jgi:hypothetical protein
MFLDQWRNASCTSTSPNMKPSKAHDLVEGLKMLPVKSFGLSWGALTAQTPDVGFAVFKLSGTPYSPKIRPTQYQRSEDRSKHGSCGESSVVGVSVSLRVSANAASDTTR